MTIKVLSKFWYEGKLIPIGTIMDIGELGAAELVSSHKAEIVAAPIVIEQPNLAKEVPDGTASVSRARQSKKDV